MSKNAKARRKQRLHGAPLREKNGRIRRATRTDHGTPETARQKMLVAVSCGAVGHPEASASGLDLMRRSGRIDVGEWAVGDYFGKLYRLCSQGSGLRTGAANAGIGSDLADEQEALRRMQRALTPKEREVITDVCGLMLVPEWLGRISRERRELVRGLRFLDKQTRNTKPDETTNEGG